MPHCSCLEAFVWQASPADEAAGAAVEEVCAPLALLAAAAAAMFPSPLTAAAAAAVSSSPLAAAASVRCFLHAGPGSGQLGAAI